MRRILPLLLFVLALAATPAQAAQPLPASPWYAVVYQPETDTLRWINAGGEQVSMLRPMLPNEVQFRDLRISPNGRTMVMVSDLNNGLQALGIYDFAAVTFIQTHLAQAGETIYLGGENIFTANSQYFATGLFSGDFTNPAWRVILFEAQTGEATAFIDHTHPNAPEVQLSAPAVQYLDGMSVHFQLIPQSVGGWHTWPAYAWRTFGFDPTLPVIAESPYTRDGIQVQLLTGEAVMSYADENFAAAPQMGQLPNFNAVGWSVLTNGGSMTTIHADVTRSHLTARWAKGGNWILFLTDDVQGNRYWNIALADGTPGNNSHMPFDSQYVEVYGTSDGYLLVNDDHNLFYTNGFMPNTALNIAQLTTNSRVVYVTPIGVNFMLDSISGQPVVVVPTNPPPLIMVTSEPAAVTPAIPVNCSLAPPQRVGIGMLARVLPGMSALNMRQSPNGAILATLAGGDAFDIIGGAICDGGLYWWQVERSGSIGWVAEGSSNEYFIEPYEGAPPPAGDGGLVAPPAATGCEQTLPPRLTIGGSATVLQDQLRPHNGPDGEIIEMRFFMAGTQLTVNAGPECAGGQHWWLVTGPANIRRIGGNTEIVQAWVTETREGGYTLSP
ncbi:MAG: hypothetical protein K8L97_06670 [Anaerolineae bacterium]|nr:hypothetical protein [Anaerolineae bacterium]